MIEQRDVVLYVRKRSLRCWRARRLLARRGYHVEVIDMNERSPSRATLKWLARGAYRETVSYVFIDQRPAGGLDEIRALARLVQGEV